MTLVERLIFVAGGIMMVTTSLMFNGIGAILLVAGVLIQRKKKSRETVAA